TGYDTLGATCGLFVDPAGATPLTEEYQRFTAGPGEFAPVAEAAKRETACHTLAAEVSRLGRLPGPAGEPALDEPGPGGLARGPGARAGRCAHGAGRAADRVPGVPRVRGPGRAASPRGRRHAGGGGRIGPAAPARAPARRA